MLTSSGGLVIKLKIGLSIVALLALGACGQEAQGPADPALAPEEAAARPPQTPLGKALNALGGAESLQNLDNVTIESAGSRFALDQQFLPGDVDENPVNFTMTSYFDGETDSLRLDLTRSRPAGAQQASLIIAGQLGVITGQDAQFVTAEPTPMTSDRWAAVRKEQALLNPHIAFRDALTTGSVTESGDFPLDGANHHVLTIEDSVAPIKLYVSEATGNITRLSTMETDHLRRDAVIEVTFDNWAPAQGGLAFPDEVTMTLDGVTVHEESRSLVAVNTHLPPSLFDFPAGVSPGHDETLANWGRGGHHFIQMMASLGFPRSGQETNIETEELAPGVHHIRGNFHHSMVMEQENGIIVAEAPLHELRSEAVIGWIESSFPDKPITHVIATHHHSDHSAGLRPYVARGAIAVVHEVAEEFFAEILQRPSTLRPDALAENPVDANLVTVPAGGSYTIPDASRSVSVYPLANDHAADMVLIHVQGAGIVFVSDIYNPNPNIPPGPGGQLVLAAIEAAGIEVSAIAGGHGGTIDYEAFRSAADASADNGRFTDAGTGLTRYLEAENEDP